MESDLKDTHELKSIISEEGKELFAFLKLILTAKYVTDTKLYRGAHTEKHMTVPQKLTRTAT